MHFIIIKGQNSFRSDLERTKRRERRRNRKKTECTLAYINSWWRNGTFQMIPQYPYIRIYFLRLLYCVLGTHAKGDKVSTPNESKSWSVSTRIQKEAHTHTHTRTSERKRVWCNQKSKVFETRSRILYKHVSFIQKSRRDIKVGDATMRTEYTHIHFHKERT